MNKPSDEAELVHPAVLVVCDSRFGWWARFVVIHRDKSRRRCKCPQCGKMATMELRGGAAA